MSIFATYLFNLKDVFDVLLSFTIWFVGLFTLGIMCLLKFDDEYKNPNEY